MKKHLTFILMVMLVSLVAVGAYAQTQSEPVKKQAREDGSENAANPGTSTSNQNYTDYENAKPAAPHDPSGPAGSTAEGSANQGKPVDADKAGEQPKEQTQTQPEDAIRTRTDEGPKGSGTATTDRTRSSFETQQDASGAATGRTDADKAGEQPKDQTMTQTKPEDAIRTRTDEGPKGQGTATTDRTRSSFETQQDASGAATGRTDADKASEDCTGDMKQDRNYSDVNGIDAHGGINRHGDEFTGVTGPHGPILEADKAGEDASGEQRQTHNYNDAAGLDANGGINRHGDEFTGEGGPHGPMGTGPDLDMLKIFGEDTDGTLDGVRWIWGPAVEGGGAFGPNDGVGYGPGGPVSDDDKTTVIESRGQRAGRR